MKLVHILAHEHCQKIVPKIETVCGKHKDTYLLIENEEIFKYKSNSQLTALKKHLKS